MLQQDDRNQFVEAMAKEIGDHTKRKHWEIVPRSQMPRGIKPIMAIWSFKTKQYPYGTLKNIKLDYARMEDNSNGALTTGRYTLQL